jgi:hypothetical protein
MTIRLSAVALTGFVCLSLFCDTGRGSAQTDQLAIVQGHVLRLDKTPVRGAEVEFHPFAGMNGINLPGPVLTDETGFFHIEYPPRGQGWVTASKTDEGYPNAALALYGRDGYSSLETVDLKPGSVVNVELRFGKPDAILVCTVSDPLQQPVRGARILIQWPEDPQVMMSRTIPKDGIFQFVLPRHAVYVEVSAPGYTTWHYQDPNTGLSVLTAKDVKHIRLTVVLHPVSAAK